jgi:hypothetical protein
MYTPAMKSIFGLMAVIGSICGAHAAGVPAQSAPSVVADINADQRPDYGILVTSTDASKTFTVLLSQPGGAYLRQNFRDCLDASARIGFEVGSEIEGMDGNGNPVPYKTRGKYFTLENPEVSSCAIFVDPSGKLRQVWTGD